MVDPLEPNVFLANVRLMPRKPFSRSSKSRESETLFPRLRDSATYPLMALIVLGGDPTSAMQHSVFWP